MKGIEKSLIAEINKLHGDILKSFGTALEKAIRIGELLTKQKEDLKHGEFTAWVNNNLPFTDRTARNYMRVYGERDRLKTETVSDLSSAYQLLIEDKSQSKEIVEVLFCGNCDKLVRMEDADECPPLYECSNDNCGTTFVGTEGRNCPDCNRPFSRKLADHACEDCEGEMEETTAFECGNDGCSQHGLHLIEEEAKGCKDEKTRTILDHPTDEVEEEVISGEPSEEVMDNQGTATQEKLTERQKQISRILNSERFSELRKQWAEATKDERRQFLRIRIADVKDKLSRYRFSNESNFSESEKEYYAPDIDQRTVDIILKFGVYYNEAPRFRDEKKIQ